MTIDYPQTYTATISHQNHTFDFTFPWFQVIEKGSMVHVYSFNSYENCTVYAFGTYGYGEARAIFKMDRTLIGSDLVNARLAEIMSEITMVGLPSLTLDQMQRKITKLGNPIRAGWYRDAYLADAFRAKVRKDNYRLPDGTFVMDEEGFDALNRVEQIEVRLSGTLMGTMRDYVDVAKLQAILYSVAGKNPESGRLAWLLDEDKIDGQPTRVIPAPNTPIHQINHSIGLWRNSKLDAEGLIKLQAIAVAIAEPADVANEPVTLDDIAHGRKLVTQEINNV